MRTNAFKIAATIMGSIILLACAMKSFAVSPSKDETFNKNIDGVEWKYLQFSQHRYKIDGERLYVCLKEFSANAVNSTCEDSKHRDRWVDSKSVIISGFAFQRYEILYTQATQSTGDDVTVNLIMRYRKALTQ